MQIITLQELREAKLLQESEREVVILANEQQEQMNALARVAEEAALKASTPSRRHQ